MSSSAITPVRVKTTVFKNDQDGLKREPLKLQDGFMRYLKKIEGIQDPPALPPRRKISTRMSSKAKRATMRVPMAEVKEQKPKWNPFEKMFKSFKP